MQVNIANILKPIGMLYNAMLIQRQHTMIPQKNLLNCYTDAISKLTFIFPLSLCIISGNDTYTFNGQLKDS